MSQWKLVELAAQDESDCTIDDSGVYVVVNRVAVKATHKEYAGEIARVRADIMLRDGDEPMVSFIGSANHVRKAISAWLSKRQFALSIEHASYIGYELLRAELTLGFIQD